MYACQCCITPHLLAHPKNEEVAEEHLGVSEEDGIEMTQYCTTNFNILELVTNDCITGG